MDEKKKKQKFNTKKIMKKVKEIWNESTSCINKTDVIIISIICLIYGIFSFINLGSTNSPQTFFVTEGARFEAKLELETSIKISKMRYFVGPEAGTYKILVSKNDEKYEELPDLALEYGDVLKWKDLIIDTEFKYIKLTSVTSGAMLGDIQFYDNNGNKVETIASDEVSKVLVDEKDTVPQEINFMNSSYFDEIYFPKTAYQYIHGIKAYECVHPPLGKLIQAIPILVMGFTPFAWRFAGNICGILIIAVMYIFGKNFFKRRKWAIVAALLMVFDNFHFAQTRMGTVDSELVLFMLLTILFMYHYINTDKSTPLWKRLGMLFLSGVFAGCSITTKWSGGSACLLIAIMFFYDLIKKNFGKDNKWTKDTTVIFISCFVFFLIIPFTIYCLAYFFFPNVSPYYVSNLGELIDQIKYIFVYHSQLTADHPFASKWYTWPLTIRPVWYYSHDFGKLVYGTISCIGNVAIWWPAAASVLYLIYKMCKKYNMDLVFILVAIACMWLPFIFIGRVMFLYHFFPTLPFMMFALIYTLRDICDKFKSDLPIFLYLGLIIIIFWLFYPISSGIKTTKVYVRCMEWLSSWYF